MDCARERAKRIGDLINKGEHMSRNRKNAAELKKERDEAIRMFNAGKPQQEIIVRLDIPLERLAKYLSKAFCDGEIKRIQPDYEALLAKSLPQILITYLEAERESLIKVIRDGNGVRLEVLPVARPPLSSAPDAFPQIERIPPTDRGLSPVGEIESMVTHE